MTSSVDEDAPVKSFPDKYCEPYLRSITVNLHKHQKEWLLAKHRGWLTPLLLLLSRCAGCFRCLSKKSSGKYQAFFIDYKSLTGLNLKRMLADGVNSSVADFSLSICELPVFQDGQINSREIDR